jgi:hypothetical protein
MPMTAMTAPTPMIIRSAFAINKLISTGLCPVHKVVLEETAIANIAPEEARRILESRCDRVKLRADANGGNLRDQNAL